MGWFRNLELDSFDQLLLVELQDLYDAENRLVEAIPKMADGAHCRELNEFLLQHLQETKSHVDRLEQILSRMGVMPQRLSSEAMKGLIADGNEILSASGNAYVKDAAIISAARRIEQYEMAGYGTVRTWAEQLNLNEIADVLQQTLDEEANADKILNELAEQSVDKAAMVGG